MSKNPILVVTGLAVAAVAGIAGLTKDKWMGEAPQQVASTAASTAPEAAAPAAETPAPQPAQTEAAPAQPAAEQPAASAAPATQPPAEQPAEAAAPAVEAPAAEQPAAQQAAAVEAPAVETVPEQQAAAPAAETPPPQPAQPEQPAPAAEAAAPAAPAETAPAVEQPIAPAVETVPAFDTVRVEKTGEAVIAGTAEAGSEVVVKLDGQTIGTATANGEGAFVVVPDAPLPSGSGALTIESKGKGDQQAVQSEQSVAVIIPAEQKQDALVAVVSPDAPTKILQKPSPQPETQSETQVAAVQPEAQAETPVVAPEKQEAEQPAAGAEAKPVSIDAVDYDTSGNIVFSGQGQPGNTARVYVDNAHTGDAAIAADGRWSFSGTASIAAGQHSLRVDGIDAAGKVANRVEVPFFREETSKVAANTPAEPAVTTEVAKSDSEAASEAQPEAQATAAAPQPTDTATSAPKQGRVVIQPGNNLWRISRVLYGSGEKYTMLYQANKDQIRDPDMIFPGQIFTTPEVAPKIETIDPKRRDPLKPEENAASAP